MKPLSILSLIALTTFTSCKDNNPDLTKMILHIKKMEKERQDIRKANSGNRIRAEELINERFTVVSKKDKEDFEQIVKYGGKSAVALSKNRFDRKTIPITITGKITSIDTYEDRHRGGLYSSGEPKGEYIVGILCKTGDEDVEVDAYFNAKSTILSLNVGQTIKVIGNTDGVHKSNKLVNKEWVETFHMYLVNHTENTK